MKNERHFSDLHFKNAPLMKDVPPGNKSRKLLKITTEFESNARTYAKTFQTVLIEGKGATLKDIDGNVFIDFLSGCGALNAGHNNPFIQKAVMDQTRKIIHCIDMATPIKIEFLEVLLKSLPSSMQNDYKIQFCSPAGTDAVEAALKLAKYYTKRHSVIAFEGSYHGMTHGAVSCTSDTFFIENVMPPMPAVYFLPYAYCYRCPLGKEEGKCHHECSSYLVHKLEDPQSGIVKPSAIIIEPVQGEGGTIIPPKEFLKKIRQAATKFEIPLIIDEIQSGIYRTGKMFAFEHYDIIPDIFTISKSISGIGLPLALTVYHNKYDVWPKGAHVGTFRSNQLGLAAGKATLEFFSSCDIESHVASISKIMVKYINEIAAESYYIGDVRALGLIFGIEFVKDKDTKEPYPELVQNLRSECFKNGLIVEIGGHFGNVIRFLPPLTITESLAIKGLDVFKNILSKLEG